MIYAHAVLSPSLSPSLFLSPFLPSLSLCLPRGIPSHGTICYQGRVASGTARLRSNEKRGEKRPLNTRTRVPTGGADVHVPRAALHVCDTLTTATRPLRACPVCVYTCARSSCAYRRDTETRGDRSKSRFNGSNSFRNTSTSAASCCWYGTRVHLPPIRACARLRLRNSREISR